MDSVVQADVSQVHYIQWTKYQSLCTWYTTCRQALLLLCHSGNSSGSGSMTSFYSGLVQARFDDILGLLNNQLDSLFQLTLEPMIQDNFQKSLSLAMLTRRITRSG